jgi:hypothetical protein
MANEISKTVRMSANKTGASVSYSTTTSEDMTGDDMISSVQSIATSAETVNFGEITGAPGLVIIKNLDSTNYVEFGGDSGLTVFKLKLLAGKDMLIRPQSATLYAQANTAAVKIQVIATEA